MTDSSHSSRGPTLATALKDTKVRQVAQHFFTKSALLLVSSRTNLPQSFTRESHEIKVDKWFGITLDDADILQDDLTLWSTLGISHSHAPPLFVEIYLDATELPRNDTIVVQDERGRRWDACEALEPPTNAASATRARRKKNTRVVLERWKIQLIEDADVMEDALSESMATIYKKAVVMFRSIYTYARLLPAWGFGRRLAKQPASLISLRPMYRVTANDPSSHSIDPLKAPLYPSREPVTRDYRFDQINTPAGVMNVEVTYRTNCNFRVDDAEAILSSRLMGMDVQDIRPSTVGTTAQRVPYTSQGKDMGSLPADNHGRGAATRHQQTYGSLSTYHQTGPPASSSPLTTLRAAQAMNAGSPSESPPLKAPPDHRSSHSSKSSLKPVEGPPNLPRRVSVSFQPFKAGSLASSPATGAMPPPNASRPSSGEGSMVSGTAAHSRSRSSLSAIPQSSLRALQNPSNEVAVGSPASNSPKAPPITRYSSSFGNRKARWSSAGGSSSRTEDGNTSSGKASQSSSNQPGSGLLAEGGSTPASVETDDNQIADFLNLIEKNKDLRSLNRTDNAYLEANSRRTREEFARYQRMRDSHTAFSESMSSSLYQPSSTPSGSSRQPSSVPPLLAGASVSTSSSPSKPVSPRTPHTPAIPSRLSAPAIFDEVEPELYQTRPTRTGRDSTVQLADDGSSTTAIDIPTSPQHVPHIRRSSSAAHRRRALGDDFAMRINASAPLHHDDRAGPDLSLNELFAPTDPSTTRSPRAKEQSTPRQSADDEDAAASSGNADRAPPFFRSRLSRAGAGSGSSARGSNSSIGTGSAGASGSAGERGGTGRFSFSHRPGATSVDDDEPLVFTMSDMGAQSRRSMEGGEASGRRGLGERGGDSASSSRRGSKKGPWS